MLNSKPRFAYDEETNSIYDYQTAKYVPLDGTIEENGGEWDLKALKHLILRNQDITPAFMPGTDTPAILGDKVEQANADFAAYGDDPKPGDPEAAAASDAAVAAAAAAALVAAPEPAPTAADIEALAAIAAAEAAAHAEAEAAGQAADVAAAAEAARLKAIEKGELPADPAAEVPVDAAPVAEPTPVEVAPEVVAEDPAPVGSGG